MMQADLLPERRAPDDSPAAAPPGRADSPGLSGRRNRLRAAATTQRSPLLTVGVAGLAAGAVSMALGEYVSVSSQRDVERHQLALEYRSLVEDPAGELAELARLYRAKGLSASTAAQVAVELTATDALAAHAEAELRIDLADLANPWQAAVASAVSFVGGALIPLVAITLPPPRWRVSVAVVAVLIALMSAGRLGTWVGGGRCGRAVLRVLIGGATGLAVTYWVGHLAGATFAAPPARAELSPPTGAPLPAATDVDARRAAPVPAGIGPGLSGPPNADREPTAASGSVAGPGPHGSATRPPAGPAGPAELHLHHLAFGTPGRHRLACRASRLERCAHPSHHRPRAAGAPSPPDPNGSYVKWVPA
jgi:VIT1/CCC1 family predicted Fe2+/Mn2+ transporter